MIGYTIGLEELVHILQHTHHLQHLEKRLVSSAYARNIDIPPLYLRIYSTVAAPWRR